MISNPVATVELTTQAGCALVIGRYPRFSYDANGGGGRAQQGPCDADGWQALVFDPASLVIPELNWRTTRFLGLPLPPGLAIAVLPEQLQGRWQPTSGAVQLRFRARFRFKLAAQVAAPDLIVDTQLVTASVQGQRHRGQGQPLNAGGEALLVGVATVQPSGEPWFDRFLGLPDEALALMRCRITADSH
jgi:hypothetical protein